MGKNPMKTKWLVETTGIPEDIEPLFEALDNEGIEYKEIDRKFVFDHDVHEIYGPDECVVFFGTLQLASIVRRKAKWIPGVYYNVESYNCDHYYPHFGDLLLNCDYIMLPFGELIRRKEFLYEHLGEDRSIFLRPNRGDKIFTGSLIHKEHFEKDVSCFGYNQINPHELIIAARPINLAKEWRFICVEGKIITGSAYKENNIVGSEYGYSEEAFDLATKATGMYNPDIVWVIDIGLTKGGRYAIVEVGCFSCAGLYKCNREVIVREVSQAAWKEWKSYQIEDPPIDTCPITGEKNCAKCSGEYCETHFDKPCDCDVIERHCYD